MGITEGKLIITGGKVILPEGIHDGVDVICDRFTGKISAIVRTGGCPSGDNDITLDAGGRYVSPGFIDIHVHGGGGHDFMDGTVEAYLGAARAHAVHGTTSMIPTTLTCTDEELYRTFKVFDEASSKNKEGAHLLGLHLEGPYFSPEQSGAQDPAYLQNPRPESYLPILDSTDKIMRWSVAPELDGAMELGDCLRNRGILPSIAHSNAVCEVAEEAFRHGYTHATHLYCAMSSVTRRNAFRTAGIVEAAYLTDGMTVEIIADGVHLPSPLLRFVYKFKGPQKTVLCTDAMRAAGMPDGEYLLGSLERGQKVIVEDGVAKLPDRSAFAGSVATTDRLVRTMMSMAGVPLEEAVRMMTMTPAKVMRIDDRKGSIEAGKDADIVIFDGGVKVSCTIRSSEIIYSDNTK